MTKPVARVGDFHGCPKTTGKVPHVGGPIVSGSPNVFIAGVPVARMGDPAVCAAGGMDVIAQGSPTVFVNGQPLACAGHITAHGGVIVSGAGNVIVGDAPAGGSVTTATSLKVAAAQGTATTTAAAARAATAPAPAKANATSSPLSNPLLKTAGTLISAGGQAVRQIKARTQPDLPQQLRSANQRAQGLTGADTTSADQPQSQMKSNELIIGVFFDGTGNHKDNDRLLTDRDITNVARLFDMYRTGKGQVAKFYINGIGTADGEWNGTEFRDGYGVQEYFSQATGLGVQGGLRRIQMAYEELDGALDENLLPEHDTIIFDVVGFSRGAALARHFVNEINLGLPRLSKRSQPLKFEVRFVGLFDTVGSFYLPGNDDEGEFNLNLAADSAKRVVHLTAYHEIRKNFPLTSIRDSSGSMPAHFTEIELPGVHSDVGGGYENPEVDFANVEFIPEYARVGLGANPTTIQAAQRDAERDGLYIIVRGLDVLVGRRKWTRKELALYALEIMKQHMMGVGVLLNAEEYSEVYAIPTNLQAKLSAWQNAGGRLEASRDYLEDYIHTSHTPFVWNLSVIGNIAEPSERRRIFPNRPNKARRQKSHAVR